MILTLVACSHRATAPTTTSGPTLEERFGTEAFVTPIDAPPEVAMIAGGSLPTTAATCGGCHPDHYQEWSNSTHAYATRDLQFSAELAKPGQPRWLCLNCHAPTRPQRSERIVGATRLLEAGRIDRIAASPEPSFDAARVSEGVSCATCHVRRDTDGQGLIVGPRGSGRAPHRVRADPAALGTVCLQCHSPSTGKMIEISPTFVCWFQTADEVARGQNAGASCPSCHMPLVERSPALGAAEQSLRRHLWLGGGVPKVRDGYAWLVQTGWTPGFDVAVARADDAVTVTLTNARAGHDVPTADPERHLRVDARLEDAAGAVVARDSLRIGQRWDWGDNASGRVAHRLEDNRLAPGEVRTWSPGLAGEGERLVVEVTHVRLTTENARGMATAALDDELTRLWPESPQLLPQIEQRYPLETTVFRVVLPRHGEPIVTPLSDLLASQKSP